MAQININKITNANVYSDGNSLLGKVEEITLPEIKDEGVDHNALGMAIKIDLPSMVIQKMNGKIKFNAVYPELITEFGSIFTTKQIQVRGNLQSWTSSGISAQQSVVAFLTVRFKNALPPIGMKQGDNPEMESEYSCSYYRLEINGVALIEVDAFSQTYFVNGVDQLAEYRKNLGI